MALNKPKLKDDLKAMMDAAQAGSWTKDQVAEAMAAAIDTFVRAGVVRNVKIADHDRTLTQTGEVTVQ